MSVRKSILLRSSSLVLLGDQIIILLSFLFSFFILGSLTSRTALGNSPLLACLAIHAFWAITAYLLFAQNKKITRFYGASDYLQMLLVIAGFHVLSYATAQIVFSANPLPLIGLYTVSCLIACILVKICRLLIVRAKSVVGGQTAGQGARRVLIYGTGQLGVALKRAIGTDNGAGIEVVGFLDNDQNNTNRFIEGVKVFDLACNAAELVERHNVTDIIITVHNNNNATVVKKFSAIPKHTVCIREITSAKALLSPHFDINNFSAIDINKLVNRAPIELYNEHVEETLQGKRVLVTGAAGSIGSEIVRKLAEHKASLIICVDFAESALYDIQQEVLGCFADVKFEFVLADIRDEDIMYNLLGQFKPHFMYHAASYKHVPLMEQFPWHALQTNVFATWRLVKMAVHFKVEKFVFVSTDKAVKPNSIMGATKRLAEIIIQAYSAGGFATCFAITRFGNVLGSNGSVVPLFRKQIEKGGPVTVTHPEMTRYFMTIAEACQLVLEASVMAEGGEILLPMLI